MEQFGYIVLVPMVYLAVLVFSGGIVFRLISLWRKPKTPIFPIYPQPGMRWLCSLKDTFLLPTVRKHNPVLWCFLMIFHLSFILLIIGHIELIQEFKILQLFAHKVFLGRGFVGLFLCIALLFFLFRRFMSPNRELSVPEDYYLLILMFLTVLFGSELDWARSWFDYGELSVGDYRKYLSSLTTFKPYLPSAVTGTGHSFMLVLHIFFANLFLMFFPFSKIMHAFFSMAVNKLRRG
jgi:nitrate reductase gamma subunit